ncbi:hypothetical protein N8553_01975 [bacterium]|jgi:hypothetical protein|nr:hypothetical protein [bacterium]
MDNPFIEIDAPHLCVMENEAEELCNDGIYGKALAEFLQAQLSKHGYRSEWIVCEDWGWCVPAEVDGFNMFICVYGFTKNDDETAKAIYAKHGSEPTDVKSEPAGIPLSLCVTVSTQPGKHFDWRRLRRIDRSDMITKLNNDLIKIFEEDSNIRLIQCCEGFPIG